MDRVYVVTKGCYSDYRIVAAFSDREAAELMAGSEDDDGYGRRVETFKVWSLGESMPTVVSLDMGATITETGAIANEREDERRHLLVDLATGEPKDGPDGFHVVHPYRWSFHNPLAFRFSVSGTDLERVRKVYSERRAEYLADYATIMYRLFNVSRSPTEDYHHPLVASQEIPPELAQRFDAEWNRLFPDGAPDPDLTE